MAVPAMTIDGDVVAVHSHWVSDGSRIVTEATVLTPDGAEVVVSQLGGSVDGIGQISWPGPAPLELGMRVAIAAHRDVDLEQREHVLLDSVKVLDYPPGYVRTGPTKAGRYLFWESGCVFVSVGAEGTAALPGDTEFDIVQASIDTWNNATHTPTCSYLEVINEGPKTAEVGNDKLNLIKFRDTSWCRPAVGNDPMRCYAAAAAGITTATYVDDANSQRDGAILDADIELNGVNFAISAGGQSTSTESCKAELQNTLTHELGHLHGLEHPCLAQGDPMRTDNRGNAVPSCSLATDPAILNATMYNFQSCGEATKETLSPDDIQAICDIYPVKDDPGDCNHVGQSSSGCCSASGAPGASFFLAGMTMFLVLRRRKTSPNA
jgi:MYXO-CTERM domain-containing protein